MSRKVGMKLVAAGTIAMAIGCSGAVESDSEQGAQDPSLAGNDEQDQEAVEPSSSDLTIAGNSTTVSQPTNLKVSATSQTKITTQWDAPSKGTPRNYVVYVNGAAKASTVDAQYAFGNLTCGTAYTLEVASRDAKNMISARSKVSATTAACSGSKGNPSTPSASPTGYAAAVMNDAPVAYWRLNETSGTRAADSAGNNHGTYESGAKLGAQGLDGAVSFDGVDDAVTVADNADLRLNGSFTVEFMAKLGGDANTYPGLLAKGSASDTGYIVYYSAGHKNPAFKRGGVDGLDTSDAGALATDGFKHYAFTYDDAAGTAKWYVGGNLDRTIGNVRFPVNLDSSTFALGRGDVEGGKVQFGNEVLDEVALYKSALSADRVKAHFDASGLGGAPVATAPSTPTTPAPSEPAPMPAVTSGFPIGVCAYQTKDFARLQAMGMHHARMDNPSPATIELGRTMGIEVLPIADSGFSDLSVDGKDRSPPKPENRAAWAKRAVDLWRGMKNPPKVIEVWNEPWHQGFYAGKPNPADYLELVKAFANEAWKQWPNVTLLVSADAGMSDYPTFRKDLLAADKDHFLADARILPTTHNYVENRTPTQVTGNSCTYDLNRYECAYADFKNHGHKNPQVWVTEFGWESNSGGMSAAASISEQLQGQYTIDAIEMMRNSGHVAAAYSFMLNSGDKWNYNWLRPDSSDKPVVGMMKNYLASH